MHSRCVGQKSVRAGVGGCAQVVVVCARVRVRVGVGVSAYCACVSSILG